MNNQFYKGRTNNHLTWAMVDATDFATPESALSAAMKIKIYGKLRSATGVNFVSSGTGSLTNDIQHVGASVLGLYTIALAKADLSDASAAWYDQYVISLSATGAAYQALIVDGGIDLSAMSALQSRISDIQSYLVAMSSLESDIYSQLSDFRSDLHSFVSTTGVGLHASALSDIRSAIAAGPAATVTASDISDIASAVWANAIGTRVDSRLLLNQSRISDIASYLVVMSGVQSDIYSAVSNINSLAIASPTASDIASQTYGLLASQLSDALSAAAQANSRVLVIQSMVSDIRSHVSDLQSDFQSRVPKLVASNSQLSDLASDLKSAIAGITASVSASDISDIASAVWANTIGARVDSRVLVAQSFLSDIRSHVSDLQSDFQSRVPKAVATNSQLSDLHSDLRSYLVVMSGIQSDILSSLSDLQSDFQSRVPKRVATDSQLSDMASDIKSAVLIVQSMVSDTQSKLSDVESNLLSLLVTTGVNLNTSVMSDIRSAVNAVTVNLTASDISDIASAVLAGAGATVLSASDMSDIASRVWAMAAATTLTSRVLVIQSTVSDVYSSLSDLQSDFQSRVPKRVATDSQLSDLASDVKSLVTVGNSRVLVTQSMASDAASAAQQANSRALVVQSQVSDIYSLLSDVSSDLGVLSGIQSDIYSLMVAGAPLGASDLSDLRSAIAATELDASDLSDIASAVWAVARTEPTTVVSPTGTVKAGLEWLVAASRNRIEQTATVQSLRNDANNADIASAAVSDDGTTFVRGEFGN